MNIKLSLKKFEFQLIPKEPLILPSYKGSTLRDGFGNAFRRICVLKKTDCSECILKEKCVYSYIFETHPPSDTKIMRKYPSAPHPFIIEPPTERKHDYTPEDKITFGLTLIGKASDTKTLKSFKPSILIIESEILNSQTQSSELLTLNFLTPVRIIYNSRLTINLEFHILIRHLLRRISLLSYFHCSIDTSQWDFKEIIGKSNEVIVKQRKLR